MPSQVVRSRYKVLVLGAPAAGKTALVRRLAGGSFDGGASRRGLDFYTSNVAIRDDVAVTLQLWDLSTCPTHPSDDPSPLAAYLFNTQAVLFVYDVSTPSSLEGLRHALDWVDVASSAAGGARPYFALVANKSDLRWAASEPLARQLAARYGCVHLALSAKTGAGVQQATLQLACDLAGVPLTATDHHSSLADARVLGTGTGPDGDCTMLAADAGAPFPLQPHTWPALAANPATQPDPQSSQRMVLQGRVYQVPREAAQAGTAVGVGEAERCMSAGSGSGAQHWRPVSRSATPSPTALLISRTGPLGRRSDVRAASPVVTAPPAPTQAGEAQASQPGACRRWWRAFCCCGGSVGTAKATPDAACQPH